MVGVFARSLVGTIPHHHHQSPLVQFFPLVPDCRPVYLIIFCIAIRLISTMLSPQPYAIAAQTYKKKRTHGHLLRA
jgi:hypothetical protein